MRTLLIGVGNTSVIAGVSRPGRPPKMVRVSRTTFAQLPRILRGRIDAAVLCSVVPSATRQALVRIRRWWGVDARVLTADAPHGLTIGYREPSRLGTDRLAAALGARTLFPRRNVIIVDCGTATTVTALTANGAIAGGAIFPGVALWSAALERGTAQLPPVPLRRPRRALGRSPEEAIASGVFHGHVGAIREAVARVRAEAFGRARCVVIGTGGAAALFAAERMFDVIEPALVLIGLETFAGRTQRAPNRNR